jgi:hypothetical protein
MPKIKETELAIRRPDAYLARAVKPTTKFSLILHPDGTDTLYCVTCESTIGPEDGNYGIGDPCPVCNTAHQQIRSRSRPAPIARRTELVVNNGARGQAIQVRAKEIMVAGKYRMVDPYQLMAMIKNVTQSIGEYKGMDNMFGDMVVGGFRKIRRDMVAQLEENFRIRWSLDDSGVSTFVLM